MATQVSAFKLHGPAAACSEEKVQGVNDCAKGIEALCLETSSDRPLQCTGVDRTTPSLARLVPKLPPSPEFEYFTKYLLGCPAILKAGEARHEEVDTLCRSLLKGDWGNIIQMYRQTPDDLARDGLKAYHDKMITTAQFATLLSCRSLLIEFPGVEISVQPLFDDMESTDFKGGHAIANQACTIVRATLQFVKTKKEGSYLDARSTVQFFQNMISQPNSEKSFFYIPLEDYERTRELRGQVIDETGLTFRKAEGLIVASCRTNVLHRFHIGGKGYVAVPSFSMMQQFLQVYKGSDEAINITPVIGPASVEDTFNNITNNSRDMSFAFPGMELPRTVFGFKAVVSLDYAFTDFFFCIAANNMPKRFRPAIKEYAEAVRQVQKAINSEDDLLNEFIDLLYSEIVNMDYIHLRPYFEDIDGGAQFFFIRTISNQVFDLLKSFAWKKRELSPACEDLLGSKLQVRLHNTGFVNRVAQILNQTCFCKRYGITAMDLNRAFYVFEGVIDRELKEVLSSDDPKLQEMVEIQGERMVLLEWRKRLHSLAPKLHVGHTLFEDAMRT